MIEALKQAKTDACGKPYFNALASLYINLKGYQCYVLCGNVFIC